MNELYDWAKTFVKNKDLVMRKLVGIDDKKDHFIAKYKDKEVTHFVTETLTDKAFSQIEGVTHKAIVCLNSEANLAFLTKHWKKLSEIKNLSFIFVNLKMHDKWVINPHLHSMVADPDSIESGLRTMYETANGKVAEVKPSKKKSSMFEESDEQSEDEEQSE